MRGARRETGRSGGWVTDPARGVRRKRERERERKEEMKEKEERRKRGERREEEMHTNRERAVGKG